MPFLSDLYNTGQASAAQGWGDWSPGNLSGSGLAPEAAPLDRGPGQAGGVPGGNLAGSGLTPGVPGQTPAQGGQSGFMDWIKKLAKLQDAGQGAAPMATPGQPPTVAQPLPPSSAGSRQGFLTGSSRGGFSVGDAVKVAALVASMGAAAPAVGAMGAGTAAGGTGAMAGGAGGGGLLGGILGGGGGGGGLLGGLLGGGGGGGGQQSDAGPPMSYAPLPQQPGPLLPQSANQWDVTQSYYPWMYQG